MKIVNIMFKIFLFLFFAVGIAINYVANEFGRNFNRLARPEDRPRWWW